MLLTSKRRGRVGGGHHCPHHHHINLHNQFHPSPWRTSRPPQQQRQPRQRSASAFMKDNYNSASRRIKSASPSSKFGLQVNSKGRAPWIPVGPGLGCHRPPLLDCNGQKLPACSVCEAVNWKKENDDIDALTKKFALKAEELAKMSEKNEKYRHRATESLWKLKKDGRNSSSGKHTNQSGLRKKKQKSENAEEDGNSEDLTWSERLRKKPAQAIEAVNDDEPAIKPLKPSYKSNKEIEVEIYEENHAKKKDRRKADKGEKRSKKKIDVDDVNLSSSFSKKEVEKEKIIEKIEYEKEKTKSRSNMQKQESLESSNSSSKSDVENKSHGTQKRKSKKDRSSKSKRQHDNDIFIEIIIDELKRENRELKFGLLSRDEQLKKAAEKVQEMLNENTKLSKELEKCLGKVSAHAESYNEEVRAREKRYQEKVETLEKKLEKLEKESLEQQSKNMNEASDLIEALKGKLEASENKNKQMNDYINELKISYELVFGKDLTFNDEENDNNKNLNN